MQVDPSFSSQYLSDNDLSKYFVDSLFNLIYNFTIAVQ